MTARDWPVREVCDLCGHADCPKLPAQIHAQRLAELRDAVVQAAKRRTKATDELAGLADGLPLSHPSVDALLMEIRFATEALDTAVRALRDEEEKG